MAKTKCIDKGFGAWKVTEAEYDKARELARGAGEISQCAHQLVRYCQGGVFYRDQAEKALQGIRGWIPAA